VRPAVLRTLWLSAATPLRLSPAATLSLSPATTVRSAQLRVAPRALLGLARTDLGDPLLHRHFQRRRPRVV